MFCPNRAIFNKELTAYDPIPRFLTKCAFFGTKCRWMFDERKRTREREREKEREGETQECPLR